MTGKKIVLERKQDPELLAGLVVRIGDQVIDGSAKATLAELGVAASVRLTPRRGPRAAPTPSEPTRKPCSFAPKRSRQIIKKQIQNFDKAALVTETGTVLTIGDGIARVYGLEGAMAGELVEFPGEPRWASCSTSSRTTSAPRSSATRRASRKATPSSAPAASWRCRSARRSSAASSTRSASPIDGKGPIETQAPPPRRGEGARHRRSASRSRSRCRPASRPSTR